MKLRRAVDKIISGPSFLAGPLKRIDLAKVAMVAVTIDADFHEQKSGFLEARKARSGERSDVESRLLIESLF